MMDSTETAVADLAAIHASLPAPRATGIRLFVAVAHSIDGSTSGEESNETRATNRRSR